MFVNADCLPNWIRCAKEVTGRRFAKNDDLRRLQFVGVGKATADQQWRPHGREIAWRDPAEEDEIILLGFHLIPFRIDEPVHSVVGDRCPRRTSRG